MSDEARHIALELWKEQNEYHDCGGNPCEEGLDEWLEDTILDPDDLEEAAMGDIAALVKVRGDLALPIFR